MKLQYSILERSRFETKDASGKPIYRLGEVDETRILDDDVKVVFRQFLKDLLNFGITPSIFKNNQKNNDSFQSSMILGFDFDKGDMSSLEMHNLLKKIKLTHVIAGSTNHLKDKNDNKGIIERYHVFLFLNNIITEVSYFKFIQNKFKNIFPATVDTQCLDAARYFKVHSKILYIHNDLLIDYSSYRKEYLLEELNKKTQTIKNANSAKQTLVNTKLTQDQIQIVIDYYIANIMLSTVKGDNSNETMFRMAYEILKMRGTENDWNHYCGIKVFGKITKIELKYAWDHSCKEFKKHPFIWNDKWFLDRLKELQK